MLRRFCTKLSPSAPTEQLGGLRSAALGFLSVCAVDRNLETRCYRNELRDRSGRNPKCACMGSESALNPDVQAPVLALVPESPDVAWQRLDQHCVPQDRIIRVLRIGVELHPDSECPSSTESRSVNVAGLKYSSSGARSNVATSSKSTFRNRVIESGIVRLITKLPTIGGSS